MPTGQYHIQKLHSLVDKDVDFANLHRRRNSFENSHDGVECSSGIKRRATDLVFFFYLTLPTTPNVPKTVSANTIANISALGIENVKILYSLGIGAISPLQAIDLTARNYVALVAGISFEKIGAGLGASMFSFIPVFGTAFGGIVGGLVGRIAGNKVAQTVHKGITKVASVAVSVAKQTWNAISYGVKSVARGIRSIGRAIASFLGF